MTLFGTSIETIYLVALIVSGAITLLYILFSDFLEGIAEAVGFNPTLLLAFITFFSASGYILERTTTFHSYIIIAVSILIALILDTLLNVFVLIPLSSAEQSLVYTEDSLKGRVGKVIIPIPEQGYGEVVIESNSGMISKPAASYKGTMVEEGTTVLVIEVENGVLSVVSYNNNRLHEEEEE
ncbi:hypothetical protein [Bacillus chungangensis]|uniref:Membrane-bound ClpP family serine protease n=1 Tax=Bacillus chungangensis TaxID=587633 RepID=A0ABT9WQY1_9BACI|nr:hypothetical protein [Bacillus chungangensis]MDQ0175625.1 membrane-bound ClpP family serine protease [Bacillus chungangensis]